MMIDSVATRYQSICFSVSPPRRSTPAPSYTTDHRRINTYRTVVMKMIRETFAAEYANSDRAAV
jgi:hypothetical protein